MARYIHCEACNKRMREVAKSYNELYESIEGIALKDMFCDGACDGGKATEIKKGDKCFAAVLLPSEFHSNYAKQKPGRWAADFILPIVTENRNDVFDTDV